MNKQDLSKRLAEIENISIPTATHMVDSVFDIITSELQTNGKVKIRHFGTFAVGKRKEREFKNPKTKQTTILTETKRPVFIPSQDLKQAINKPDDWET